MNDTGGFNGWGEPDDDIYHEAPPEDEADMEDAPARRFEVHDEATAAWAVGKINAARAVLAQREQAAAAWVEEARREVQDLENRFSAELKLWGSQNLPKDKKTIKLRSGRLEFRTKPARFALVRHEEALPWAKIHLPEAVITTEHLRVETLITYAKTGEVIPGVALIPKDESFTIK